MQVHLGTSPLVFYEFPPHYHPQWEILLCLNGTGTATIDGQYYPFRNGTIFCIPPMITHSKQSADGYTDLSLFTSDFVPLNPAGGTMVFQDDADGSFRSLCMAALNIKLRDPPNAKSIIDSIADTLYLLLKQWSGYLSRPESVDRFLRLRSENLANSELDLSDAIAATGYRPGHFRRLFRSSTGLSPTTYFHRMRVEYAKALLRQIGNLQSIRQVSSASGFSDPYYFSRVFKEQTGVSPSAYVAQALTPLNVSIDGVDVQYRKAHGETLSEKELQDTPDPR